MPNFGITITSSASTAEEDEKLGRTSKTHLEGRAIDVRVDAAGNSFVRWMMETPEGSQYAKRYIRKVYRHDSGHGDHYHIEFKV